MANHPRNRSFPGLICLITAGCVCFALLLHAQQERSTTTFKNGWSQRQYYDPPHETQIKMEVAGAEMEPLTGNKVLIKKVKITTYPETGGSPQMTAEAPECFYDLRKQEANSAGPLRARASGERMLIEGIGFFWRQPESSLEISNQVRSVVQAQNGTNAASAAAGTRISSDRATFDMKAETKTRTAIYKGNVRFDDVRMKLESEILTIDLPESGGNPNHAVAETNVTIDFFDENGEKNHATCDKAVYSRIVSNTATNEVVELTGHPRLERTNGWMTADVFFLDRTANTIRGVGNYRSKFRQQPSAADLGKTNAPMPPETEITSEVFRYEMNTGAALYQGNVRVDNPGVKLSCGSLSGQLSQGTGKTNHVNNFTAETNVVADIIDDRGQRRETTHATGDTIIYTFDTSATSTNETLELRGNPRLERTNGWMVADIILLDRASGIIRGVGNHHSFFKSPAAGPGETNAVTTGDTEIFSNLARFDSKSGLAVYQDYVRLKNPELTLSAEWLTVWLPENGGLFQHAIAETNVVADFVDERGVKRETTHATGEKLVYTLEISSTMTNQIVELTGKPKLKQNIGTTSAEEAIIYNRTTGRAKTLGDTRFESEPGAFSKAKAPAPEKAAAK